MFNCVNFVTLTVGQDASLSGFQCETFPNSFSAFLLPSMMWYQYGSVNSVMLLLKVFHDLGDERIVSQDGIVRGRFLGKGAFGAVYAGTMVDKVCIL